MKRTLAMFMVMGAFGAVGHVVWGSDMVLYNANVITMDRDKPRAEAVAIKGDRIVYAGEVERAFYEAPEGSRRIDLGGRTLAPGFNDNHTHTLGGGAFYLEPMFRGLSCEEIVDVVREEARKKSPGDVITGNSWDYPYCPEPHKSMLDRAAPDNPVYLVQYSGHAVWVDSAMLEKMGIDKDTPDPEGGQIVRDEGGEPIGVLRDTAAGSYQYVQFAKQLLDRDRHRQVLDKALDLYRKAGITWVQDNTWEPLTARLLAKYRDQGKLTCRFTCWPYGQARGAAWLMKLGSYDELWVREGPWKYFADGAFSTRTAWMSEPYADEAGNFGEPRWSDAEMDRLVMKAAKNKRRIAVHAIGDRAVHQVLSAMEKAQERYPWTKDLRFRLEHVQLVMPGDVPRMKRLGVVACVQPFAVSMPAKDVVLLGEERAREAYPYKTLLRAGVPVSCGSDIPAEVDYEPLLGMYYAVTRKNKEGDKGPLNPDECFTPEEALRCYTMGSAYADFMEDDKGSITAGKLADLVVLDRDPTSVAHDEIKDIKVEMTMVGGEVVYQRE